MTRRRATLVALALAVIAGADWGDSDTGETAARAAPAAPHAAAERAPTRRPRAVVADCSTRSMADFPDAFAAPDNLVAGPIVIVGGGFTAPDVIREFGGNKIPVLVAPGHRVTVQLTRHAHRVVALAYGPLPEGEIRHRDAHRAVRFEACPLGEESGSTAGGYDVTFWMGFILAREPACAPLYAWIDDEPVPRRFMLRMGVRRCE